MTGGTSINGYVSRTPIAVLTLFIGNSKTAATRRPLVSVRDSVGFKIDACRKSASSVY
jgi:hypothetical protein